MQKEFSSSGSTLYDVRVLELKTDRFLRILHCDLGLIVFPRLKCKYYAMLKFKGKIITYGCNIYCQLLFSINIFVH